MARSSNTLAALAASASVLALALGASTANAEAAAPQASGTAVEEVVVTAQKREENQQVVPVAIAAFSEKRLQTLGVESFLDYAKFVPAMSFASLGPGQSDIVLRGMPIIEGAPTVGIYVDGMSIASGFTNPDPRLFDVQDVQVLKGPQGTLYGEGAIGGLIIIRNNQPNSHAFEAKLDATWSQTDGSNTSNDELNGMINIPITKKASAKPPKTSTRRWYPMIVSIRGSLFDSQRLWISIRKDKSFSNMVDSQSQIKGKDFDVPISRQRWHR